VAVLEDLHNARVLDAARRLALIEEAKDDLRILRQILAQKLDRGASAKLFMDRLIDGAHASLADLAHNPVAPDALSFHACSRPIIAQNFVIFLI
jgi:hypothetical protein